MTSFRFQFRLSRGACLLALCILLATVPPAPAQSEAVEVTLGSSGESVTLMPVESGGYTLGDEPVVSGETKTESTNGNVYTLSMSEDGTWAATYNPVDRTVPLGTRGETVVITRQEDGTYTLPDGMTITAETRYTTESGNTYGVALGEDGMPMAVYVPEAVTAVLGELGGTLTLYRQEDDTFQDADGMTVMADSKVTAANGNEYTLERTESGGWVGTYLPEVQTAALGAEGGSATITRAEDGSWQLGERTVSSGGTVDAENEAGDTNTYTLTLAAGVWTARYTPEALDVAGTDFQVTRDEDSGGYSVAGAAGVTLPADGSGNISLYDALYRVSMDDEGMFSGMRYDLPMAEGTAMKADAAGVSDLPMLSTDDRKTPVDETGVTLKVVEAEFAMGDLLGTGQATATGPRLAANTLTELTKVRGQMERLIETQRAGTFGDDQATFRSLLDRHWTRAEGHLRTFFGEADLELERELNVNRVLDAFDRIVEAFSSAEGLAAATEERGSGFISGFKTLSAANAAKAFNAEEWAGEAALGVIGAVRYGAASYVERADATKDLKSGRRAQGFAWSTVEPVRRANHVQTQGNAYYMGGTYAADDEGVLYAGDIDVQVRFGPSRVDALVQNLARTDTGAAWTYGFGGAVATITLPEANLRRNGSWDESGGEVRLSYEFGAGSVPDVEDGVEGDFSGRLLGRDDDAGLQVLGAWKIADSRGTLLAGGYGATHSPDPGDRQAARELFLFRAALAAAGLGEGSEVDPADADELEAVVSQFQEALVVAGYSPPAARTVALTFRRTVMTSTPGQDPSETAAKTFSTARSRGMLGDPYEEDQFRLALAAAGLGEQAALDPTDAPAVEAAVNQFQMALRRAGYTTAAARAAVMAFRTTVEAGSASQNPLEVAAAVFGAAREDGSLEPTTDTPEADLVTVASASTRAVLTRNAGNGGLRPASDLEPLVYTGGEPGVAITAARTMISADNNNIVVADYLRVGNLRYRDPDDNTRWIGDDRSYELYDYKDEPRNFYKFTLDRERLFTDGYAPVSRDSRATISAEAELKSPTHVQIVREELTKLVGQLRRVVGLDGADASDSDTRFANDQRQRIFDEMQNWIRDHLLGPDNSGRDLVTRGTDASRDSDVLDPAGTEPLTGNAANAWTAHSDYPVNGQGVAQDTEVLSRVEDVLAALQNRDAFADAFAEGGIFHGKAVGGFEHDPRAVNPPSIDAMWNKSPTRIMLVTDTTDYTRMGAWQINDSAYAAQHLSWWRDGSYSGYYRITEFGEPFAYSPLAQSDYDSISASRYPAGVLATYEGRTVAMQHTVFYEGDVTAKVQWDAATVAGELRVDLNDLTARESGGLGLLQHGLINYWDAGNRTYTRSRPGTYDVETLTFWADIGADRNGKIGFEETDIDVAITYGDLPGELKGYREDTLWNVNTMELSAGRLRLHHSGSNRPSDGRATNPSDGIPNPATQSFIDFFDPSSPPAAGESVSMAAANLAQLNNLANADWTDSNGRLGHKLELVSVMYEREASSGRLVMEFEDGTTLENAIGGFNTGTVWAADPDGGGPRNQKSHVTWSAPRAPEPGFDNFFSGPGKGYLNVARSDIDLSAEISGMFVGQGPDGPLGLMGTYALIGNGRQYGTGHWISSTGGNNGAGKIYGSFGADFNPAP